ncbi:unnamed protein product [Ciceribacter sp. T2.26MG-112.2]|nr:unnamed protein product [Ciceribacter naphthalenivorans]
MPVCPSVRSKGAGGRRAFQGPGLPGRAKPGCAQAGQTDLARCAALLWRGRRGPAAPRRDSGLETNGRRFRPQQTEGGRQGLVRQWKS